MFAHLLLATRTQHDYRLFVEGERFLLSPGFFFGAGMFQPEPAQFGCISCDNLGSFYQELKGRTSCNSCPANTQRFIGVLSGATIEACQCKEGT